MIKHLGKLRAIVYSTLRFRTLGALFIAVDADGKVLMVRNSYNPAHWRLPGGALKKHESFRQGAIREASEEVGIQIDPDDPGAKVELYGLYLNMVGRWQNHIAMYIMEGWTRKEVSTWEVAEVALFDPTALPPNVAPAHRRRIEEWMQDKPPAERW